MAPPKRINPFPLSKLLQFKFLQDFDITGKPQGNSLRDSANKLLPLGNINMAPRPLDRQYQDLKERAFEANQFATLDNEVGSASSSLTEADAMTGMYQGVSDAEITKRIGESLRNLGKGTGIGFATTMFQDSKTNIPKQDDRFLDRMVRKTPQHLVDAQNAEVDRTTNAAIGNVLSNNPINRAANAVNAIVEQGIIGKNRVAVAQGKDDIGLENAYLGAKQQSLNQYNANTAQAQNMTRDSENTRIGNLGALGTNYFNQVQDSINNMNMLKDRNEVMKSNNYWQMQQLAALGNAIGKTGFKMPAGQTGAQQPQPVEQPTAQPATIQSPPPAQNTQVAPTSPPTPTIPPPPPTGTAPVPQNPVTPIQGDDRDVNQEIYGRYQDTLDLQYQDMAKRNNKQKHYDNSWKYRPKEQDEYYDELVSSNKDLAKRKDGALLTEAGYEAIEKFEFTRGTEDGKSMAEVYGKKKGYSRSQEAEIKKYIEENIGIDTWNKMPEKMQMQIYSFAFNSVKDARIIRGLAQALAPDKIKTDKQRQDLPIEEVRKIIKDHYK